MTFPSAPRIDEWLDAAASRSLEALDEAKTAALWSLLFIAVSKPPASNPLLRAAETKMRITLLGDLVSHYHSDEFIKDVLSPCVKFMTQDAKDFLNANLP